MGSIKWVKTSKPGKCAAVRCPDDLSGIFAVNGKGIAMCERHKQEAQHEGLIPIDAQGETVTTVVAAPASPSAEDYRSEVQRETAQAAADLAATRPFRIATHDDLTFANEILLDVKTRHKKLTTRKEEITKPMNAALRSVRDLFAPALDALEQTESILKTEVARFAMEERARNAKAMAEAAQAHASGDVAGTSSALAQVTNLATATPNISVRPVWRYRVVDETAIPRQFLSVNDALLREFANHSKGEKPPEVPGVEWVPDNVVTVRGAGQ